jgi:DNA-binding PadR family transcriptional regulator
LEKKGGLRSSRSEPTPVCGGKSKRLFAITEAGIEGLRHARRELDALWDGLPQVDQEGATS